MNFYQYEGAGNSFLILDGRDLKALPTPLDVQKACKKAKKDGFLILTKSAHYAYKMLYFNADGSETFCGNGARVMAHFAAELGILKTVGFFEALDGVHEAKWNGKEWGISMNNVPFSEIRPVLDGYYVHTGVPHYIQKTENLEKIDFPALAHPIRHNTAIFPQGVNVNFYEIKKQADVLEEVHLRSYERGVEAETLACGTGAVGLGLILAHIDQKKSPVILHAKGGLLTLFFTKESDKFSQIFLFGPVNKR